MTTDVVSAQTVTDDEYVEEWRAFAKSSEIPPMVKKIMKEVKGLELELGEKLIFGGPRGSLKGRAKVEEEQRHGSFYEHLADLEQKLQFFTARQVACRILGSKGYLCEHCWLPFRDCICSNIGDEFLWRGVRLWLYMHPKDFLRKNNTGKLLLQVFGPEAVRLCIYGVREQEDAMWDTFKKTDQDMVWFVYPERSLADHHVHEISVPKDFPRSVGDWQVILNFVFIDGTWNNTKAMVKRLQERARMIWEGQYMGCVSLSPEKLSVMHGLRPQSSIDRTCTAAAAAQLLRELDLRGDLAGNGLHKSADALEGALQHLLDALAGRRERRGCTTTRVRK